MVVVEELLSGQSLWIGVDFVSAPTRRECFLFAGQPIWFHVDLAVDLRVFGSLFERDNNVGRRVLEL